MWKPFDSEFSTNQWFFEVWEAHDVTGPWNNRGMQAATSLEFTNTNGRSFFQMSATNPSLKIRVWLTLRISS